MPESNRRLRDFQIGKVYFPVSVAYIWCTRFNEVYSLPHNQHTIFNPTESDIYDGEHPTV